MPRRTPAALLLALGLSGCAAGTDLGGPADGASRPAENPVFRTEPDAGAIDDAGPSTPASTVVTVPASSPAPTTTAPPCMDVTVAGDRFATDSAALPDEVRAELAAVAASVLAIGAVEVHVEGHADQRPSRLGNQVLSEARAAAATAALVESGVPPERITIVGKGDTEPILEGWSEEALAANRRIKVVASCPASP